jgi:hypothetical protein
LLIVVIPTRNRSGLAVRAIGSLLTRDQHDIAVVVSENSGPGADREMVARFCESHDVPIIAPENSLRMVDHWEWALNQAIMRFGPTHVTFLTDRMVYRPHAPQYFSQAMASFPDKIICFNHDRIDDSSTHVKLQIQPSTFRTFLTDPAAVLSLAAAGQPALWVIPRMLNSIVPVQIFQKMYKENGRVFGGISPDYYFGYRVLSAIDNYVSLDIPLLIHSALLRSSGHSFSTGRLSAEAKDFISFEGELRFETPFPDVLTLTNAMLHDYVVIARETGSGRFAPIDTGALYAQLKHELAVMEPSPLRNEMSSRLARYPAPKPGPASEPSEPTTGHKLRAFAYREILCRTPVDRLPQALRLPIVSLGGYYRTTEAALSAAMSLSLRSPLDRSHWPPGSELCDTVEPFEPWRYGGRVRDM